jgi:hypothetical protein
VIIVSSVAWQTYVVMFDFHRGVFKHKVKDTLALIVEARGTTRSISRDKELDDKVASLKHLVQR